MTVSRPIPNPVPSHITARSLRQAACYGKAERIAPGLVRVLADNAKDYTGPGTNTYLLGEDRLWIIDPGPAMDCHVTAVLDAIDGRPVDGICVTHTHMDHSPAAVALQAATGAVTYGFGGLPAAAVAATEEDVDADFRPDIRLGDGECIGTGRRTVEALHTPGHFPNHLCFHLVEQGLLFSGDHVMGWSTTAVVPPLGHLGDYMDSLDKLAAVSARLMAPSHGPMIDRPAERIAEIRAHRMARHDQILECAGRGVVAVADIVAAIYPDLPDRLVQAAQGQVRAHLDWAAETGDDAAAPFIQMGPAGAHP